MRPQVGQVLHNKYRLLRLIGDGGMGSVFEARHEVLGTTVALKFLHPELSRRAGLVQRFLQEAQVSAQIQSPHVVRVTDVDQNQNGQAFIVMEYLEGKTLQTLYEELYHARQRLSYADALEYSMQMLEGVEAAHAAGVVHRDLKPDNVIITRGKRGEPILKLLDFGIAKLKVTGQLDRGLTRPGIIMGTPEYMAPEQAYSADAVDARADIFSLGVMIFEMLAGRRPVGGDEPHQIATAYLTRNIAKLSELAPHVPADLASAVHRAMGPKPDDRFNSVGELRAALEPFWLATRPALTPQPPGASMLLTPGPSAAAAGSLVDGVRRVPKTLPPESEKPAAAAAQPAPQAALSPSGGQSIEVVFSAASPGAQEHASSLAPATNRVSQTPSFDEVGATPPPADPAALSAQDKQLNGKEAFAATDRDMAPFAGTVESPPLALAGNLPPAPPLAEAAPMNGQPGTVEAAPLNLGGGNGRSTASMPMGMGMSMPMPERAGGTAVGAPLFAGGSPGGTQAVAQYVAPAAHMPPTASMDPAPYATPPPRKRPQRSTVATFVLILLAAGGISGAVVGGIWYAQQRAKDQDTRDDPPITTAPPLATVPTEPTIPTTPPKLPTAQPPVVTPKPPTNPGPKPTSTGPQPLPSGSASATPTGFPTAFPTAFPTVLPTIPTIPTSLIPIPLPTFNFPGFGQLPQQQPSQPSQPSPQPTSTPTNKPQRPSGPLTLPTKKEIHITIRRPRRAPPPEQNEPQLDED